MNVQSSPEMLTAAKSDAPRTHASAMAAQQLPQYAVWVGLGLVCGAAGVALAIGLAIIVQLLLPPPTVLAPGTIPLLVLATLSGLCIAWLLNRGAQRILPRLFHSAGEQGLQVILVSSAFASLLQTLLFFARVL